MVSMFSIIILTSIILILSTKLKINSSIFMGKFTVSYIIISTISSILFIANTLNYNGGIQAILLLAYSNIVTLFFEELILHRYT